jgi:hypothetical protein
MRMGRLRFSTNEEMTMRTTDTLPDFVTTKEIRERSFASNDLGKTPTPGPQGPASTVQGANVADRVGKPAGGARSRLGTTVGSKR